MFLADHDIQHALERVQAVFPSFTQWTYTNASDDERSLRGCPETSPPRCEAFKPLFGDIGKQDKNAVKACSA
jgi:hypothetical protein